MLRAISIICLIGSVLALPIDDLQSKEVKVLRNERENYPDGGYSFVYETSDGQIREETAHFVPVKDKEPVLSIAGFYSYIGPDGVPYKVYYVADENGFRPQGAHIVALPEIIAPVDNFENWTPPPVALPPNAIHSLLG